MFTDEKEVSAKAVTQRDVGRELSKGVQVPTVYLGQIMGEEGMCMEWVEI